MSELLRHIKVFKQNEDFKNGVIILDSDLQEKQYIKVSAIHGAIFYKNDTNKCTLFSHSSQQPIHVYDNNTNNINGTNNICDRFRMYFDTMKPFRAVKQ